MSVQQSLATGLIGLVIAGAGAVGIYNYTTAGCLLGSCSSGASVSTGESAQVGLAVAASDSAETGDSCCPLTTESSEIQSVALTENAETCEGPETCPHAAGEATLAAGEAPADGECCGCGVCGTEQAADATAIEASLPSDD